MLLSTTLEEAVAELGIGGFSSAENRDRLSLERLHSRRLDRVGDVLIAAVPEAVTDSELLSRVPEPGRRGQMLISPNGRDADQGVLLGNLANGGTIRSVLARDHSWDAPFIREWHTRVVGRYATKWMQFAVRAPRTGPVVLLRPVRWLDAPWPAYGWPLRSGPARHGEDLQRAAALLQTEVEWKSFPRDTWVPFGTRDRFLKALDMVTGVRAQTVATERRLWEMWEQREDVVHTLRELTGPDPVPRRRRPGRQVPPVLPPGRLVRNAHEAELYCAEVLRALGFRDAEATPIGPDGGVDVIGSAVVAQVKMEAVPARALLVQALAGIARLEGKAGAFFSSAGYTADAHAWGERAELALFEFDLSGQVQPVSSVADRWLKRGAGTAP